MKTTSWLIMTALLLTGCSTMSKVNTTALTLGMTKTEVTAALKKAPDNTEAAKYNDQGQKIEIVSYSQILSEEATDRYLLMFVDDKLTEWHHAPLFRKANTAANQAVHNN